MSGIVIAWLQLIGCAKQYSYEDGPPPDTILSTTQTPTAFQFGKCVSCDESYITKPL